MAAATSLSLVLAALLATTLLGADAVWLDMPLTGTKCVSEEIQPNVVVLADYALMYDARGTVHPTVAVKVPKQREMAHNSTSHTVPFIDKVTSPYGNTVHQNENATMSRFAFTTSEAGNYLACFWLDSAEKGEGVSLNLDWKIGIAAKDWDSVAKKEKIEGVELELRKLEAAVESIHHNLLFLKSREAEMRVVSEKTNARVAWFSILSLGVCIVVSVLQLWHLQGFFQKKKLI